MSERAGLGGFLIEAFQHRLIVGESFGQGLDCDLAIELAIKGAIDQTHAAATENVDHLDLPMRLMSGAVTEISHFVSYSGTQGRSESTRVAFPVRRPDFYGSEIIERESLSG